MTRQKHEPHWPMVDHEFTWSDGSKSVEKTISCPDCGSVEIVLSSMRFGDGRLGSPSAPTQTCKNCGERHIGPTENH